MVKFRAPVSIRGMLDVRARQEVIAHYRLPSDLRRLLDDALTATNSTGCSTWELQRLHRSIIDERPTSAIEFGSGISTLVIAHAVRALARGGHLTRFVTMEQGEEYQRNLLSWFPPELRDYVEFRLSDVVADEPTGGLTGYRYSRTPDERFDWVFVDGPQLPRKDGALFDADVLALPRGHAMVVHIDGRASTVSQLVERLTPQVVQRNTVHRWTTLRFEPSEAAAS
jgi:hypothetical protein